jgi:hypothetical protein
MTDTQANLAAFEVLQIRVFLYREAEGALGVGIELPAGATELGQQVVSYQVPLGTLGVPNATP